MSAIRVPYLGRVGDLRRLPSPNDALVVASSRGESSIALASGGTAVVTRLNERRTYPLTYEFLPPADADLLRGFYLRQFGLGPFLFVDPTVRNVLSVDVSSCGVRSQAAHGWVASSGTLTRAAGAPTDAPGSGVLTWTSPGASATLQPTLDVLAAPACLPPLEAVTVSLWVKASATTTLTLRMVGYDPSGAELVSSLNQAVSAGTTWTALSVTCAAANPVMAASALVLPRLSAPSTGLPTSVSIAAAQVEYGDARTTWQLGHGSPRVLLPSGPGREVQQTATFSTNHTLTLVEI